MPVLVDQVARAEATCRQLVAERQGWLQTSVRPPRHCRPMCSDAVSDESVPLRGHHEATL